jgi:hypothetical protein
MTNLPTWHEYVLFTDTTAAYPDHDRRDGTSPDYPWHGLREEYGELHGVYKRMLRDDGAKWTPARLVQLRGEIGDCLWYCARLVQHWGILDDFDSDFMSSYSYGDDFASRQWWLGFERSVVGSDIDGVLSYLQELATEFGWTLAELARENMSKLRDRKARGVIHGHGGDR